VSAARAITPFQGPPSDRGSVRGGWGLERIEMARTLGKLRRKRTGIELVRVMAALP
jgi:hypothetical protein